MNANELADVIGCVGEDWCATLISNFTLKEAATMLRQQQAEIEALKDFAIWMTGCGYDFCQHDYFNKCRDELLVGKAQEK
jgi:hypothetical protein